MRKAIILSLLGLLIFQFASTEVRTGLSIKAGYCAEKEKTDPNQWDFGQIKQGAVLKHDFILKNETNNILGINSIHTSCGCTVSESAKKSLLPQESTTVTVTFKSEGYLGPVTQFVYVNTDNPNLEIIKFTIKAQVEVSKEI
ncbi:MAG: DUF1573 domain-containing protein [Candidatus Omnitrophica bacterium]|nr:DUF1573 domain-containing protein [Candidatus Omnitrophota bacterium]